MNNERKTDLILKMASDSLEEFFPLLQKGVEVEARVGCTLESLLNRQWDIPVEYAAERITTIFLNSRPVDSLATALITDGAVLALSGAMPGLVGATMRRGGYYAAMREGISHHNTITNASDRIATVRVKLFNLLLTELGPGFLQRGINISATDLLGFIQSKTETFWRGCRSALLNNYPLLPPALLREELFTAGSTFRLSVIFIKH